MSMPNFRLLGSASILIFVASLGAASAGTINLSSGTIDYLSIVGAEADVQLVGDRGFTFDGQILRSSVGAQTCAGSSPCLPGSTIDLLVVALGQDVRGVTTLDGISYPNLSGDFLSMSFHITGETTAPPFGPSQTETLVVPVTFTGTFVHGTNPSDVTSETLVGNAIATVTLTQQNFGPPIGVRWRVTGLTYDIVAFLPVAIDIKPKTINAKSHGKISVAILSTETFDATTIDPQTLRFGETGAEQSLAFCAAKDVNHDRLPDLRCFFETDATGFQQGDTTAVLTGETFDGTQVSGSDSVQVR